MTTMKLYTVGKLIRKHNLIVFSKTFCPFCLKAKKILNDAGVCKSQMKVMELDEESDGDVIQETIKYLTGHSTVPSVFIGGNFLGGATQTENLYRSGKLTELLKSNNVI